MDSIIESKTDILRLILALVITFTLVSSLDAQNRNLVDRHQNKLDLGFNMTSVISSFSGNGNFLEAEDLPFILRLRTKKSCLRLALGITGETTEFIDNITGSFRETSENRYFGRVGFEYDLLREGQWDMYIGLDFVGTYLTNKVLVNGNNSLSQNIFGAGLSPFAGVKFYLGPKVYLGTEANFTFIFESRTNAEFDPLSGNRTEVKTEGEQFSLNPPLFFYVNFKL